MFDRRKLIGSAAAIAALGVSRSGLSGSRRELQEDELMQQGGQPGLVLPLGPPGSWSAAQASCPRVLRLADDDWRMWYYGRDPDFDPLVRLPTGRIGVAQSRDGLHWQGIAGTGPLGCVLGPADNPASFDSAHVGVGDVQRSAAGFDMWYFGGPATTTQMGGLPVRGFPLGIGLAQSTDGRQWSRIPGPFAGAWLEHGGPGDADQFMAGWPQVLRLDDGRLRMYYHSYRPVLNQFVVCAAESQDGRDWQKLGEIFGAGEPGAFDAGGPATRQVLRIGERWLMFYEGFADMHASIGLAESVDGLHWSRLPGPLKGGAILYRSPAGSGRWDAGAVGTPWVVPMQDGGLRMYYVGADEREDRLEAEAGARHQIGLALGDGADLTLWRRWNA